MEFCDVLFVYPEDRAQTGVSIMIRRGLDIEIDEEEGIGHGRDENGRVVWILGKIRSKIILIIGVYGPPQGDDETFFNELSLSGGGVNM